jgi:hypothetical protein
MVRRFRVPRWITPVRLRRRSGFLRSLAPGGVAPATPNSRFERLTY